MNASMAIPRGAWPALLTPLRSDLSLDRAGLDALIDYYVAEGAGGVFAVCTSGEFIELTQEERLEVARRAVQRANGRMGVVATGNFGPTLNDQIESVERMGQTGVDAVVIATSMLPQREALGEQIASIAERTQAPLGIYEAPIPTHDLLTADEVGHLARTGRFFFFKETSRTLPTHLEKAARTRGTPLRIFQANLKALLEAGTRWSEADGFCGYIANAAPRLLWQYLTTLERPASPWHSKAAELLWTVESVMAAHAYPASAKYLLSRLGLPIGTACRFESGKLFARAHATAIDDFLTHIETCLRPVGAGWRGIRLSDDPSHAPNLEPWASLREGPQWALASTIEA